MTTATFVNPYSDGIRLPEYLVQLLDRFPIPSPEQELELIQKAKRGHEHSLTWLMVAHVRLVSKLAKQYAQTLEDGQDLIQEGMIGIRRAVERFDPEKGCKFSTYARSWIQGRIKRFSYKNRPRQLRLPEKKQVHLDKVYKLQHQFPDASPEEIAQKANLKLEYIEDLLIWGRSFQEIPDWHEFTIDDSSFYEDSEEYDEYFDYELEAEIKTNLVLIKAPQPVIPPKYQIPIHLLKQWFRVDVAQFVNVAKGQVEAARLGFAQGFSRHSLSTASEVGQERVNLSTWPASLLFSYENSINTPAYSQKHAQTPTSAIIQLVKGSIVHVQKSLLVLCGRGSDGSTNRPGNQPAEADQRCRRLGEPRTTGRGYLGFRPGINKFIQRPLAAISDYLRGFSSRAGPDPPHENRRGAVFDSKPPPQQHNLIGVNAMYKTIAAFIAAWLGLLISPATAETIKIAPGHGHLIDLTSSGCRVSKAYMGTRGIFDLSLDQPQPQTQKIYLTWKPNTQVKSTNLILDLVGCNRSSMELTINRSDSAPSSAITRIGAPTPIAHAPEQPRVLTGRLGQPSVRTRFRQTVAAGQPLTLKPKAPSKPKSVKRPPVQRVSLTQPSKPTTTATPSIPTTKEEVSGLPVTPATLLRGLNIARASGDKTYRYRSEMHWRVNGMIRQMRWGASAEVAAKRAKLSPEQIQTLIHYAQQ